VSQMPEVAGSWPEEGAQYVPGAPREPAQQAYPPQAPYQHQQPQYLQNQQQAQQQGYEPQYPQAQQEQQQYAAPAQPGYQEQTMPQQAVPVEDERSSVPSEFDHLFRDSAPQDRRAISGRQPVVSGPGAPPSPGFQQNQAQQQAPQQQMQPTQMAPQAPAGTAMFNPAQQQPPQGYDQGYDNSGPSLDYGGGPFSYDGPPGGGTGNGNRRTPLIIGGAVAVIAVVGLYLGLSGGGSPSTNTNTGATASASASAKSTETAQQEADALYALVKQAKTLRSDINGGVDKLLACDITDAQSSINATAQARQSAATQVAKLPVDKISGAAALVSALQTAWQDSANSDQDYAKAAADFASGGCTAGAVKADANYRAAQSGSGSSASAKDTAASLWNQVMVSYESKIGESDL